MSLHIVPCSIQLANSYVERWHRHNGKVLVARIALAAADEQGEICGVGIAGLPRARMLDDGLTMEVLRCATNGAYNACSFIYGALWRATKALGYKSMITYTLMTESAASINGVQWTLDGMVKGRSWDTPSRRRETLAVCLEDKRRWRVSV